MIADASLTRKRHGHANRVRDHRPHGHPLGRQFQHAGLDFRHVQNIVDDRQEEQPARINILDVFQLPLV